MSYGNSPFFKIKTDLPMDAKFCWEWMIGLQMFEWKANHSQEYLG